MCGFASHIPYEADEAQLQTGVSTTVGVMQIHKNAEQQHEKLMEFLNDHPGLTNSDQLSSVCVPTVFGYNTSLWTLHVRWLGHLQATAIGLFSQ
jgi:hypothetical protein